MKTLIVSAAVAVATLSGAAQAMTTASDGQIAAIQFYAPGADVSGLTNAEVASLLAVIHSGDSESEKFNKVRAALN